MLKNKAADAICKPDIVQAIFTSGFAFFSSNALCFQENRGAAAVYKLDAVEAVYSDALIPFLTWLPLVLEDKYIKPRILGNKKSLICIVIELSKKEDKINLRTKQIRSK